MEEEFSTDFGRVFSSFIKEFLALGLYRIKGCSVSTKQRMSQMETILNFYGRQMNLASETIYPSLNKYSVGREEM